MRVPVQKEPTHWFVMVELYLRPQARADTALCFFQIPLPHFCGNTDFNVS